MLCMLCMLWVKEVAKFCGMAVSILVDHLNSYVMKELQWLWCIGIATMDVYKWKVSLVTLWL